MMHSTESLAAEYERLRHRPDADSAPPDLGEFTVDVPGDPAGYVARLRSALSVAVGLGATADFEQDSLPTDDVPAWFAGISSGDETQAPDHAMRGRVAYTEHTGDRPWPLQEWLYRFDPDEDSRGWQWWDVTPAGPSKGAHLGRLLGRVVLRLPGTALGGIHGRCPARRRAFGPTGRRVGGRGGGGILRCAVR